uniref:Uncharacterized protein n=1 Tax=Meloidogyne enterolobii TaxID=390850 RepID=A0A6V7U9U0_MELEN|nr:unnamed protein product [Meloidogyne enterolobii]
MSISLKNSDIDLTTLNNSINSLNDDKSMTDDSASDCCIIVDNKGIEEEVQKLMMDILQNKIFDDGSPTQDEILKILRNRFNPYQLNASKATRYVNEMFGKTVLTEDEARNLFKRFSDGKTNRVNQELLEKRFKENPKISAAELAIGICSKSSAMRWLSKKNKDVESNKEKDKTPYSNKLRKRNAGQMADNVNKEKQIVRKGHTADKERTDGQHSICQIDPVTKKRFYEPHKRPDCDDIYCLSSVTQIGERICNIENKMIELEELFCALVKKNTSGNNKITNNNHHQQQPSSFFSQQQFLQQQNLRQFAPTNNFNGTRAILGCSLRNILPIQGRNEQIYRPNTSVNTSSQVQQRIIAPTQPFAVNTRPPPRLPIASATATISTTRPLEGYPMPRQLNIIRPQINENSSYKPLDIPHKELKNGVRVFFMDITTSSQNTCPVCFGVFPGIIFTDRSASIIQNVHLKRHTSGPLEAFYCQICSHCVTQPRVLFLSLPSIVQHLINSHGMPKNVKHDSFYIRNFNNSETTEALQHFIANQLKLSITQLITEMNSSNLNWAKTVPYGQFVKSSNPPTNTKNKQKVDNTKNNQQNKKKKKRGREETPPFDLNGDPLDQLLKCPSQCTLIQRHRTHLKRKQVTVKQILEPIKMQNVIIDLSLIGLAKYIDYKNDKGQIRSDKQIRKEGNEGGSDSEDKTDESEDNEDEETSSNDSDYSPRKANRGFETRKRKKMESSERSSSTNIVDQLQQHRLQQIIEKNLNNTPSSSQSLPAHKGLMNFTSNSPLSSNGVQNVVCKTEPANQQH